ncbi:MAG TPA: hypothetical protein VF771_01825, partial [Longimicrobiaceae bacterium]
MTRIDRWLRWVWLINGVALLALLAASAVFLIAGALQNLGGGPDLPSEARSASKDGNDAPLRYDPPDAIRGSATRIVVIRRGTGYTYRNTSSSTRAAEAPAVNVAFLDAQGARLLLDRPAYIAHVRYPGEEASGSRADSLR